MYLPHQRAIRPSPTDPLLRATLSVVSQGSLWLVAGALGAAMTFAASAALHATILAGIDIE
jgi:hypothetical protein